MFSLLFPKNDPKMNQEEIQYLALMKQIIDHGDKRQTRNSTCRTLFGASMSFNLSEGKFPLLTTKKVSFRNVFYELKWFLMGDCNVKFLRDNNVNIWNGNAEAHGSDDLGPIYGKQFRASGPKQIDQIAYCLDLIKNNSTSRRIVISLWNPSDLAEQALPCCKYRFFLKIRAHCPLTSLFPPGHGTVIQFFVVDGFLSLQMYQRSADVCLGLPYNVASYSLLLIMMAHCTGLQPGKMKIVLGDSHVYENHIEAATEQTKRFPLAFPELRIKNGVAHKDPAAFILGDFVLCDYQNLGQIKFDFVV